MASSFNEDDEPNNRQGGGEGKARPPTESARGGVGCWVLGVG
eukprot:CAMPEP_0172007502 /NCGR_PEP_ID=MMETSP1041-20130122/6146_1 /TAXON_ID=464988 /ORGANISM="Hemiselmis andersenii, Strain CCMP439" /LENGTH=41 /DNA_ID= /DNA_START= /DNA_END= /DNA_ORIENTATION=